ncbi:MAG: dihydropteroate synthase [Nitrosopumilus sp. B06]|nr:MAG: dihydropteroate synthase [Nitrosopumilus sp. B06]
MALIGGVKVGGSNPVRIMGILNVSPESFYKKSVATTKSRIRDAARCIEDKGADFIDIGGMSTAPYLSTMISERTETRRILDAVSIIQNATNLPISVDTCRAGVASAALGQGVEIINDVTGLKHDKAMRQAVSEFSPSVILCAYHAGAVSAGVATTRRLLKESIRIAKESGASGMVLDPAIGFFRKSGRGIYTRIKSDWTGRDLSAIKKLGSLGSHPVMVSVSNKSFLGAILGKDPGDRLAGSLAAEAASVIYGADIIRTHNVEASRDAAAVAQKLR